ncbi:dihydroneopterin aldolase [Prevotella sp. tc2-28]|jgi:dihydroneopterin aldolase|uniref:dihydroneopterin aldolase n=1 Tax=Prevotella sp. tc2-28 TaxID=1761888 RepID=UPI0008984693|nr:dihydroneopterin aldolase [Prevotella sp. tc2-28]SEA35291.1 dihydroneopterin aldolase [Prevotella sp. tc2-28]
MRISQSYIILREVRFHAFHGVMPQERKVGADFTVSLRVGVDLSLPAESDDVADTLNYATLYEVVKQQMEIPSQLLEHVAGRIGKAVMDTFPQVTGVDVTLTKLNPPMGADCAGASVELHLINDKTKV